jgi:hypothetical protein
MVPLVDSFSCLFHEDMKARIYAGASPGCQFIPGLFSFSVQGRRSSESLPPRGGRGRGPGPSPGPLTHERSAGAAVLAPAGAPIPSGCRTRRRPSDRRSSSASSSRQIPTPNAPSVHMGWKPTVTRGSRREALPQVTDVMHRRGPGAASGPRFRCRSTGGRLLCSARKQNARQFGIRLLEEP